MKDLMELVKYLAGGFCALLPVFALILAFGILIPVYPIFSIPICVKTFLILTIIALIIHITLKKLQIPTILEAIYEIALILLVLNLLGLAIPFIGLKFLAIIFIIAYILDFAKKHNYI